ncbi:hypothetical protein SprV_0200724200 [Sparganum proliferum]
MCRTSSPPDQHLSPTEAGDVNLDASPAAALAAAGVHSRPKVISTGRAAGQDDLQRRRPSGSSPRHLQDETSTPTLEMTPDHNASVETQWRQLRNIIHSTALEVLGCARSQQRNWLDDNAEDIRNVFAEKNKIHRVYIGRRTGVN